MTTKIVYNVFMLSFDEDNGKRLLSVAKTKEHAEDLVDDYSERFPNAYVDYEKYVQ